MIVLGLLSPGWQPSSLNYPQLAGKNQAILNLSWLEGM
jgi:hypothetical protein